VGQRSKIEQLDPRVREIVDQLVREGRASIDDIVARLRELLGPIEAPSRSSVGRYVARANAQMSRYREAREVAKVWFDKLDADLRSQLADQLAENNRRLAEAASELKATTKLVYWLCAYVLERLGERGR
jgi:hypothetical protein